MLKKFLVLPLLVSGAVFAADPNDAIKINFTGRVTKPSCNIQFDSGTAVQDIAFGAVNVSDLRYYAANTVGTDNNKGQYSYSNNLSRSFQIQISGCSADRIASDDNGNQFSLTIAPISGEWVSIDIGNAVSYMNGGLAPSTGATGFAAKFLIAHADAQGNIAADPASWDIFTGFTGTVKPQSDNTRPGDKETESGKAVNVFKVSLAKLPTSIVSGDTAWLIPLKVKLGMKTVDADTSGDFRVSAAISASYY